MRVWDLSSGNCFAIFERHDESVWSVAMTPDGSRAVSGGGGNDQRVIVWDLDTLSVVREGGTVVAGVNSVAITDDGRFILFASNVEEEDNITLWNLIDNKYLQLSPHEDRVEAVVMSGDGLRALSGGYDGELRLWNLRTQTYVSLMGAHKKELIWRLGMSRNGNIGVSCCLQPVTHVWDLDRGCLLASLGTPGQNVGVAVSSDGRCIVTAEADGKIRIWDL